jgi:Kazal-type serine protease inhibitor-like protein
MPLKLYNSSLGLAFFQIAAACSTQTPPQEPSTPAAVVAAPLGSGGSGSVGNANATVGSAGANNAAPTEKMCGGIAGVQCGAKEYCAYAPEARCGAADMSGSCAPVPSACVEVVDEVCGCDDKTYGNPCKAAQAGVSVAMKGACAKPPPPTAAEGQPCGARGTVGECAAGLYCLYAPKRPPDVGGRCTKKPTMCTKIYAPVCGGDGKTYGSACTAASEGVSVEYKGACKP